MPDWLPLVAVAAALGAAFLATLVALLRRPAAAPEFQGLAQGVAALAGRLDGMAAAQERLAERLGALQGEVRTELTRQEGELSERVGALVLDQTKALGASLLEQAQAQARQTREIADRLAATEKSVADSIRAQNEALGAVLAGQTERVTKQLAEQGQAVLRTAGEIQERLAVIDAARANMEALGGQVATLANILGNKQARGAFGEVQLHDMVVDRLPADGFAWQHTLSNKARCDCLIRLPYPPGPIAIDSKFPLEAWRAARDAPDDAARSVAARQFVADVRRHVADVAGKYVCPGETAECALIFIPSEAVYADLHAAHPALVAEAAQRGVHLVSPSTMWAVLTTMRALMRDVRMRAEARRIKGEVAELLADVRRLDDRVVRLKKHFADMQQDVGQIDISTGKIARRGAAIEAVELPEADGAAIGVDAPARGAAAMVAGPSG